MVGYGLVRYEDPLVVEYRGHYRRKAGADLSEDDRT
jgi:hypothetical protein